jgi:hypothetical protein
LPLDQLVERLQRRGVGAQLAQVTAGLPVEAIEQPKLPRPTLPPRWCDGAGGGRHAISSTTNATAATTSTRSCSRVIA